MEASEDSPTTSNQAPDQRNKQYKVWKEKALKSWERLEKTHLGVSILDETININFRQERIIYEKNLGGRL